MIKLRLSKKEQAFLLSIFTILSGLTFLYHDDINSSNLLTILVELGYGFIGAFLLASYFFQKELNTKEREENAIKKEIEFLSRNVSIKLFTLENNFPEINNHYFVDSLSDLKRISELFTVAFPLEHTSKNQIENSYAFLNQARVNMKSYKWKTANTSEFTESTKQDIDSSIKLFLEFGKRFDPDLDSA